MGILGATLTGLLMLAEQDTIIVATGPHGISPKYHQTDYESACGPHVFRVRFRNGPEEQGRVDHLLVDDRPVRNAAQTLPKRCRSGLPDGESRGFVSRIATGPRAGPPVGA